MSLLEMLSPPTEGALSLSSSKKWPYHHIITTIVGILTGMRKCDADRILRLFNWTEIDEAMLTKLQYRSEGGGSLASKKYKHMCFMFELFFAVALQPSKNITNNPTCEWQLRLYSKANT
jgi:hypothetical protein